MIYTRLMGGDFYMCFSIELWILVVCAAGTPCYIIFSIRVTFNDLYPIDGGFYMCFSIRVMDFSGLRRWDGYYIILSFLSELLSMIYTRLMGAFYICFSIRAMDFSGLRQRDVIFYSIRLSIMYIQLEHFLLISQR